MSEASKYATFRARCCQPLDRVDRIENVMVIGMPDVNCCMDEAEFWIEIKTPIEPKRKSSILFASNHSFSVDQINWFIRQRNAGGTAYALIATDCRWILIDATIIKQVNKMTVDEIVKHSLWDAALYPSMDEWLQLRTLMIYNCKFKPDGYRFTIQD